MIEQFIKEISGQGALVGVVVALTMAATLIEVCLRMIAAINSKFTHAETMMIAEITEFKARLDAVADIYDKLAENLTRLSFALMRVPNEDLQKAASEVAADLQGKK